MSDVVFRVVDSDGDTFTVRKSSGYEPEEACLVLEIANESTDGERKTPAVYLSEFDVTALRAALASYGSEPSETTVSCSSIIDELSPEIRMCVGAPDGIPDAVEIRTEATKQAAEILGKPSMLGMGFGVKSARDVIALAEWIVSGTFGALVTTEAIRYGDNDTEGDDNDER